MKFFLKMIVLVVLISSFSGLIPSPKPSKSNRHNVQKQYGLVLKKPPGNWNISKLEG